MENLTSYLSYFANYASNPLGTSHFGMALVALLTGVIIFTVYKGTVSHKWLGYTYFIAMLVVNVSALMNYRLTGGFNMFHAFAIVSLATLLPAIWAIFKAKETGEFRYYLTHSICMSWSYFGLFAAFVAESFTRFILPIGGINTPWFDFSIWLGLFLAIGSFFTSRIIRRQVPQILSAYQQSPSADFPENR